jgi:hypothetical protein
VLLIAEILDAEALRLRQAHELGLQAKKGTLLSPEKAVKEFYLAAFAQLPAPDERAKAPASMDRHLVPRLTVRSGPHRRKDLRFTEALQHGAQPAQTPEQFKALLEAVLRSPRTKQVVEAIMAQATALGTVEAGKGSCFRCRC